MSGGELGVPGVRRLCLVVDVEGYSRRLTDAALDVQDRLLWTMHQACRVADVDPSSCARQDQGDGQLLILPPGIDEGRALPGAVRGLRAALHRLNRKPGAGGRIRLRASVSQGLVYVAATGFVGTAVVHACRVLDSPQLRATLGGRPDSDLALAVTDDLYRDVLTQRREEPAAGHFDPLDASVPEKGFEARGWVYVPRPGGSRALVPAYTGPVRPDGAPQPHRTDWGRRVALGGGLIGAGGLGVWAGHEMWSAVTDDGGGTDPGPDGPWGDTYVMVGDTYVVNEGEPPPPWPVPGPEPREQYPLDPGSAPDPYPTSYGYEPNPGPYQEPYHDAYPSDPLDAGGTDWDDLDDHDHDHGNDDLGSGW
ncbi:hypothetical protein [Streptomyces phaeofaciens]|uniref:hypothetical protein n=1 Tax=Streptomyces phaeofaciens TaxID=68254 RepID=UPI0036B0A3E1